MARISQTTISETRERSDALAVVGSYVRLENRGGRLWGLCPFHNEKTASFTVDPDRRFYHCFGCGVGGDIIDFVMNIEKLKFPEAVELVAQKSGITIVYEDGGVEDVEAAAERKKRDELADLYQKTAASFHYILTEKSEGAAALSYIKGRGISDALIDRFMLGYAPKDGNWLYNFLSKKAYSSDFLKESALFARNYPKFAFFRNRLLFPICNHSGKVVAFGGRALSADDEPKYLNSSETALFRKRENLFALNFASQEIRRQKEVFVVEGYMDALAMHEAGITNTVAPLGTAFTEDHAKLLARHARRVIFFLDTDEAGQAAAEKALMICTRLEVECAVINPTIGGGGQKNEEICKDPAEILQKNGAEVLHKVVKNVIMVLEFFIHRSRSFLDNGAEDGKRKAALHIFPYVECLTSAISRSEALGAIANAFFVDSEALLADYTAWAAHNGEGGWKRERGGERGSGDDAAERALPVGLSDELFLVTACLANIERYPSFLQDLRSALPLDTFRDGNAREVYLCMEEWAREGGAGGVSVIIARIEKRALKEFCYARIVSGEFDIDAEKIFSQSLKKLKKKRLEERRKIIVQKLTLAKDAAEKEDLLGEKMYIDDEITKL